jgi:uncharacterized membrane protein
VQSITDSPRNSLIAGLVAAAAVLVIWLASAGADAVSVVSFLVRLLHVLSAMVWIGLVFFVNFVQLVVLRDADEQGRGFLHKAVVPNVAWWFRHASTLTVASGAVLIVTTGYLLPALVYGTGVYVPPARGVLLWAGVVGALVMWMFVHMYIWPSMQVVLGLRPGDANAKLQARQRVILCARLNLILAIPVTLTMVAAAHLY